MSSMVRLLIADADVAIARAFRSIFEHEGYEVDTVVTSAEARDHFFSRPPSVVLVDMTGAGFESVELLKEVRSWAGLTPVGAVVFCNPFLSDSLDLDTADGLTEVLSKSDCSRDHLVRVVRDLVSRTKVAAASVAELGPEGVDVSLGDGDTVFQKLELRARFSELFQTSVTSLRAMWQVVVRSESDDSRLASMRDLSRIVHSISGHAAVAGLGALAQVSAAFEALLLELVADPYSINPSTLRTMAHCVDFLAHKADDPLHSPGSDSIKGVALAVDDEATSLWAVGSALELARIRPISMDDPEIALRLLKQNRFEIIFLDVEMPGKTGYDVCKELRTYSTNKTTPVVFVTSLSDFSSRAKSTLSGGNDFIAKPFLLSELAVKALILVFKSQTERQGKP